jgi:hypothetical protein
MYEYKLRGVHAHRAMLNVRALLDDIAEEEDEKDNYEPVGDDVVDNGRVRVEEVKDVNTAVSELDRLDAIKTFDSMDLEDVMDYLGEFYFTARNASIWAPEDMVNWIDMQWMRVAYAHTRVNFPRLMDTKSLLPALKQCMSIESFGVEAIRYQELQPLLIDRLRAFWLISENEQDAEKLTELVRRCTRFVSAVAYVRTHVVGDRTIRHVTRTNAQKTQFTQALDDMLKKRATELPEQVYDALQQIITTCLLPVDAAANYELIRPTLGIYAGSSTDVDSVVAACTDVDSVIATTLCEFVPWDRPKKPMIKLTEKQRWLWEVWQLHVFAFMFHSAHCSQSGAWAIGGSDNVLDAGLFSSRYLLTWWYLFQPQGLKKLQCKKRFHTPTLPLLIQAGNGHWWVRTQRELLVCSTLGSALHQWLHEVSIGYGGMMEDVVPINVNDFCPGLFDGNTGISMSRDISSLSSPSPSPSPSQSSVVSLSGASAMDLTEA